MEQAAQSAKIPAAVRAFTRFQLGRASKAGHDVRIAMLTVPTRSVQVAKQALNALTSQYLADQGMPTLRIVFTSRQPSAQLVGELVELADRPRRGVGVALKSRREVPRVQGGDSLVQTDADPSDLPRGFHDLRQRLP